MQSSPKRTGTQLQLLTSKKQGSLHNHEVVRPQFKARERQGFLLPANIPSKTEIRFRPLLPLAAMIAKA